MIPAIPHMSGEDVQVALPLPVRDGGQVALPLVPLVVHVDIVETPRKGAPHDVVLLERRERLAEVVGHTRDLYALGEHVVDVPLLWRPWVELPLDAVEPRPEKCSLRQVRIAGRVDGPELEASSARHPDERRPVLPA